MASFIKKAVRGELPGQRNDSKSKSRARSNSSRPSGESEEDSPNGRVIPPEPVQQQVDGDFSITNSEAPLQAHNLSRASKRCQALEWDSALARDAEKYAKTLASTGVLESSGIEAQGENLYVTEGDADFEDAVDDWLSQEKKYDSSVIEEGGSPDWSDFTQCLWKNTKTVGMGKARSKDGKTYVVARYSPPGNVPGELPF